MTIDISNRLYSDIQLYCDANNLDITEYITSIIAEKHALIKYGDLNVMMNTVSEQSKAETKKSVKKSKKTENDDTVITTDVQESEVFNNVEQSENIEQPQTKIVKKKRTLKTL